MMKFFRKYMKHLLVAGTVFLMIAFVGGSALTSWLAPDYAKETEAMVRGQAFGEEVTFGDMQPAFIQATILSRVIPRWEYPWMHLLSGMGMDMQNLQMLLYQLRPEPLTDDEWYMLLRDSENSDTYISSQHLAEYKENFGLTAERIAALRDSLKVSTAQIDRAIASYVRVLEEANQVINSVVASEADIQSIVRQTEQKIDVDALIIASENFLDESDEPTQEDIQAHYDEYKNEPAPRADTGVLFGYQLPEEVKIEYVRIDADALQDRQKVSVDEAFEYWEKNTDQFFKPQTQPAEGDKPAPRETYSTFTEAQPDVVAKLQTQKARREAISVARSMLVRLSAPWADQPTTQPGGYKAIPESQRSADVYPDLVESFRNDYPDALTFVRKDFMTQQELNADTELARASAGSGPSRTPLAQAAFFVPGTSMSRDEMPEQQRLFRNLYETARDPFVGGSGEHEGDVYILRTVAVNPPQAPPLDDIRDRVIADLRQKRAYQQAEKSARELAARVNKDNRLREAFLADEMLTARLPRTAFQEPRPFALNMLYGGGQMMPRLMPNYVPELGYDPGVMEEVSQLVETHKAEGSHPVTVYEQKNQARWLVIQIDGILPVTTAAYENSRQMAIVYVRLNMMIEVLNRWFDPQQIRARVQWKDAPGQADTPAEDQAEEQTPEDAEQPAPAEQSA